MSTFYSYSFGCRVNQAEKEELDRQLQSRGYTFQEDSPALYIINSCSVTRKAEREAKQLIYQIKKKYPETKVIVTGCAATNWIKTKTEIPQIDMIVDNQNKEYLAELIQKRFMSGHPELVSGSSKTQGKMLNQVQHDKFMRSGRMFCKLQDGCQRFCTYCIVPYLRGLPKSIPKDHIVSLINTQGKKVQEAVLASINTEAYGFDTKESFIDLLKTVLDETEVPRLSFGSIHPWSVNQQFFDFYTTYSGNDRIVDFFHIPLQSGSNKILRIMKRGYTREEFVEKLALLGSLKPHIFMATDIIVGYLEETDEDFQDTFTFLKESPIVKFHVFRFSKREHTAAFHLAKRLMEPTPEQKKERAHALIELSNKKYASFQKSLIGSTFDTLILEKQFENGREGLLKNQMSVTVDASTNEIGTIRSVEVFDFKNGRLFGRIV
jgi:threonylcarbamoyladenosine tRNA methylthiotransferase MtaB